MSTVEVGLLSGGLVSFTQIMLTVGIGVSQLIAFVLAKFDIVGIRIIATQLAVVALATFEPCACSTRASSDSKKKP